MNPRHDIDDDELDALLRAADGGATADFGPRLMRELALQPLPRRPARWRTLARQIAWLIAAAIGASEALAFIFSLWAATTAIAA
jgi:hypothetical protein